MNCYLLKNGKEEGPYSIGQMVSMQLERKLAQEDQFRIEGQTNWKPMFAFNQQREVMEFLENEPISSPCVLAKIARNQKILLFCLPLFLIANVLIAVNPSTGYVICVICGIGLVVSVFQLARSLRESQILYLIPLFFPCISLISILLLSSKATAVLKKYGIRVGLMGARSQDVAVYAARVREAEASMAKDK